MKSLILCLVVLTLLYSTNATFSLIRREPERFDRTRFGDTGERGGRQDVSFEDDENFIVNGDFTLPALLCIWQIRYGLEGWTTAGMMERGLGNLYNFDWGNIVVIELDSFSNDVFKQRIPLQPGYYTLSFRWAGRTHFLWTSGMSLYWNDRKIFEVLQAPDDRVHVQHIPIFVPRQKTCVLEVRGEGKSDCLGMTVANFALKKDWSRSKQQNYLINPPENNPQVQLQVGAKHLI